MPDDLDPITTDPVSEAEQRQTLKDIECKQSRTLRDALGDELYDWLEEFCDDMGFLPQDWLYLALNPYNSLLRATRLNKLCLRHRLLPCYLCGLYRGYTCLWMAWIKTEYGLEEYLRAWNTQEMIAERFEIDKSAISRIIENLLQNGEIAKMHKTFEPYLYNIWTQLKGNKTYD